MEGEKAIMYQFDGTNNLPPGVCHADIERSMVGEEMIDTRAWEEDLIERLEEELGREPTREELEAAKELYSD